ncbi:hypothetical protein MKW94_019881 [Papaver nudicaule]|uniref:Peroxidase n=1 Tax=Papaver nudicaule TaxID=74823 RepID=A0AA41V0F3_PAPNU|nr:hypothetical protein [Papaver nudicaule]
MGSSKVFALAVFCVLALNFYVGSAQLKTDFYSKSCPNVEKIVKQAVALKFKQTFVTAPATLRLFFHDCMVNGCDASVMIQSTPGNKAEKDHPDNLSLAGDGFDTVNKAKAAVEKQCKNKVSCADILALATRDVIVLTGGQSYPVELGRRDGLKSTAASVNGNLPKPTQNLNQLNAIFRKVGLDQNDLVALSAAHSIGFSHCNHVQKRLFNWNSPSKVDPTLNKVYADQLKQQCPRNVDPRIAINMDPATPKKFDIQYYKNLQQGKGLFTSDQVLFTDSRSRPVVDDWAKNANNFNQAFKLAMTKLGRVGVLTGSKGNIRRVCDAFN